MADRGASQSLTRYWAGALVLVLIALIIYYIAGGPSTPGPQPEAVDTTVAPVVEP